jgi:hypothetical protein
MAMSLSERHFEEKKITVLKDKKINTNFFLKFSRLAPSADLVQTQFDFSLTKFSIAGEGFASATFLSHKQFVKKSKQQL